ncbi:polymerase [Orthohepadnavirus bassarisci]|uniref:Protein P n=1 Tax=Ringtail hepadnavirus TaxID=2881033 RepID=A0A8K1IBB2_9HEPA|nr:polymerase [Ringtail hepadnavirus]UBZ53986.1 polymerase [Ringtail hepadnavirus]UBZ53993.1 polymerase [Ringtail hepadnavirus]
MHPFYQLFQNTQLLDEEGLQDLLEHPEDALPLLADPDLNHRVADALHLDPHNPLPAEPWVHKWGNLLGLYTQKEHLFNPDWKIPKFPQIHLRHDLIPFLTSILGPLTPEEKRRFKLSLPAHFFPRKTHYFPLHKGIKDYYPAHKLTHFIHSANYLWNLWDSGITYHRLSARSASFKGQLYPWEQKRLLSHGPKPISSQSSGFFPRTLNRFRGRNRLESCRSTKTLAPSSPPKSWKLGCRIPPPSHLEHNTGERHFNKYTRGTTSGTTSTFQSKKGEGTYSSYSPNKGHSSTHYGKLEREVRIPPRICFWKAFLNSPNCSSRCLRHLIELEPDWGPCNHHGDHTIRTPWTPRRITGGVFLVDKNPYNSRESRLVVDFSQFSRGDTKVPWPKFAVPNLRALTNLLSSNLYWLSLDVSAAFYHLPLSPGAMPHLLVGSPGLEGLYPSLSLSYGRGDHDYQLQNLHSICRHNILAPLLLLYKTYGRKLHLLAHPFIMGFRKIPMGVGLSPFLLAQFTAALASVVRRTFSHCMAFAYMDDVVLGARTPEHLESLYSAVCHLFLSLGIHLNPEKTQRWGHHLNFMGLEITSAGSLPQQQHKIKALKMLKSLPTRKPLDFKILQRITGLLGYLAPFTQCGYPLLMPIYAAISARQAFTFSRTYKQLLINQYLTLYPVRRQRSTWCQVFADATPTGWGLVNHSQHRTWSGTFTRPLPIHVAELVAACLARCWTGASVLGVDNQVVCSKKYTHFPWLLGCTANWILRDTSFCYVPSELNPADAPSRGLLGFRRFPPPLRFHPSTGRTSLFAVSPPVPSRTPDRVHFASPVLTSDAWRPP